MRAQGLETCWMLRVRVRQVRVFTLVEVQLHGVSVGFDETTISLAGEIPVSLKLRISKGPWTLRVSLYTPT